MNGTQTPTLARTDLDEITPDRLADIDYSVYHELTDFEHRGARCNVEQTLSYLGAAIQNAAVMDGEESAPSSFTEYRAVEIAADALVDKFPAWFGDADALADLRNPPGGPHLSKADLVDDYYAGQVTPDTHRVAGHSWDDQKRVVIPLLALTLDHVREQMAADSEARTNAAQRRIKRTILYEAHDNDLSESEVDVAVDAAKQALDKS